MWQKVEILIPVIAILVSLTGSFVGARIGRRDLLNQATEVLNEQGDEAILQYKMMKAMLSLIMKLVDVLHQEKIINGAGEDLRREAQAVQDMLEKDVITRKEKMLYVRGNKWQKT